MSLNTQHTTNTNYNTHNFCDVPRSVNIKHHHLSVRGDQGSSVVIHGQSVAIRYHPMSAREDQSSCRSVKINHHVTISDRPLSVREGQASSFVSLHQGMRLPDKQTRYRQADKQDNKEDHKVSGFGCSEAPSAYPPTVHNKTPLPLKSRAYCTLDGLFGSSAVFPPRSVALRFRLHSE